MTDGTYILPASPVNGKKIVPQYRSRAHTIRSSYSRICGAVLMGGGCAVLVGWLFDLQTLKSVAPLWPTMKVNTAVSFVLCGFGFWHLSRDIDGKPRHLAATAALGLTFAIASLTLVEYASGHDLGLDEFLMRQPESIAGLAANGRMSLATASSFLLLTVALLSLSTGRRVGRSLTLVLGWLLGAMSLVAVVGYVYGVERVLYPVWPFASMALHTALLFGAAAAGILTVCSDRGPLAILALEGSGSSIARRILPLAILLPLALGWMALQGADAGIYDLSFGLTLLVSATILAFTGIIVRAATSLNRADSVSQQANSEIAREAVRRRVLFEQARDGILILDEDRNVYEVNASFAGLLGYPQEELVRMHPWDWEATYDTPEKFFAAWPGIPETTGQLETRFRRKSGDVIDVDLSYTPAEINGSRYLYCVCRDVSHRKHAEKALVESQERFKRALANIPDVVVIYDRDLRIRFINEATRAVTGRETEDFLGLRDDEIFPPEVYENYLPTLQQARDTRSTRVVDTELSLPGTGRRALRITCVPLLDRRGQVREILGITHDYTTRKEAEAEILRSQLQYRELIEQAAAGIFISDADGRFQMVNSACCKLLGYAKHELLRMNARDTYLEEEVDVSTARLQALASGQDLRYERMLKRKNGQAFPAEVSVKMLDSGQIQVIFHDITTRRQQEIKIARLSRIHAVLSGINSAIVRIRDRRSLYREACRIAVEEGNFRIAWIGAHDAARRQVRMLAQAGLPAEFPGPGSDSGPVVDLMPHGPAQFALEELRPVYDNDIAGSVHLSKMRRIAVRQGAKSVIALPLIVEDVLFGLLVLYASERNFFDEEELQLLKELSADISFALESIAKGEKAEYLAFYDPLTDLPNRKLFFDSLRHQLTRAKKSGQSVILQLVDIDRFRMINETYGREGADRLITAIATRIDEAVGDEDLVARVGPDVFAVAVAGEWQTARAAHILEGFYSRVFDSPFSIGHEEVRVSAKAGVAVFPDDGQDGQALMHNAEAAQHTAKKDNLRLAFYSPAMNERVGDSIRLENRLRRALERDETLMWYQPKVSAAGRRITGYEALMRWHDRERGEMVSPGKFIPIMEETGLILEAGRRALSRVIHDCAGWAAQSVPVSRVAVNVSLMQLRENDFVDSLINARERTEAAGCELDIELTESVLMENVESIVPRLRTLSGLGVRIAVDDFGTGYSSLAYISRLPIHALKIDRSFVFGMMQDQNSLTIVKTTITLAHSLGLKVVAEGVETAEQAELLTSLECDEMQGYYFSPPVPPDEVGRVLRDLSRS